MGEGKSTKKTSVRGSTQSGIKAVSFSMNAPDATSIALVGDFNVWYANARQLRQNKSGG